MSNNGLSAHANRIKEGGWKAGERGRRGRGRRSAPQRPLPRPRPSRRTNRRARKPPAQSAPHRGQSSGKRKRVGQRRSTRGDDGRDIDSGHEGATDRGRDEGGGTTCCVHAAGGPQDPNFWGSHGPSVWSDSGHDCSRESIWAGRCDGRTHGLCTRGTRYPRIICHCDILQIFPLATHL